jgi:hypothetical protein
MKFRLTDMDGKKTVHEGIMPRVKAPDVVTWGSRAFVKAASPDAAATYREVEAFRIGEFR